MDKCPPPTVYAVDFLLNAGARLISLEFLYYMYIEVGFEGMFTFTC